MPYTATVLPEHLMQPESTGTGTAPNNKTDHHRSSSSLTMAFFVDQLLPLPVFFYIQLVDSVLHPILLLKPFLVPTSPSPSVFVCICIMVVFFVVDFSFLFCYISRFRILYSCCAFHSYTLLCRNCLVQQGKYLPCCTRQFVHRI